VLIPVTRCSRIILVRLWCVFLAPIQFPTRSIAEAALRALLEDFLDDPDGFGEMAESWGKYPIALWNSHEPDECLVFDNLYNYATGNVETVTADLLLPASMGGPVKSTYTLASLPEWDAIDSYSKLLATVAVEEFMADPGNARYADPTNPGVDYVAAVDAATQADTGTDIVTTPDQFADPSSLQVRGE
jgi:hypothetical protein